MQKKAKMVIDKDFKISEIDKRIYGSFLLKMKQLHQTMLTEVI